jgi:hypothetical protein
VAERHRDSLVQAAAIAEWGGTCERLRLELVVHTDTPVEVYEVGAMFQLTGEYIYSDYLCVLVLWLLVVPRKSC